MMRDLLDQIEQALRGNLYYVALFPTLAIPDMCAALESEDGIATRERYIAWFDEWVAGRYAGMLDGGDCYFFRCSLLHQGSSQNARSSYSRVLFIEPGASTNVLHCNVINDALNIDVRIFCMDMVAAAREWLNRVEGTVVFQRNYPRFMQRYPNGLAPYIRGVPVIS